MSLVVKIEHKKQSSLCSNRREMKIQADIFDIDLIFHNFCNQSFAFYKLLIKTTRKLSL